MRKTAAPWQRMGLNDSIWNVWDALWFSPEGPGQRLSPGQVVALCQVPWETSQSPAGPWLLWCSITAVLCCAGVEPGLLSDVGQCHTGPVVCGRNCPTAAIGNGVLPQCLLCFSAVSVVCVSVFPKPSASPWFLHLENGQTLFPLRVSLMVREHCIILLKGEKMEKWPT